jgi:hypothetical protein
MAEVLVSPSVPSFEAVPQCPWVLFHSMPNIFNARHIECRILVSTQH